MTADGGLRKLYDIAQFRNRQLASFQNRKAELESALLSQEANVANIETQYKQADLDLQANETLYKEQLISLLTLQQKRGLSAAW